MVASLKEGLDVTESFTMYVKRECVLEDALKRTLKPTFSVNRDISVSNLFQGRGK